MTLPTEERHALFGWVLKQMPWESTEQERIRGMGTQMLWFSHNLDSLHWVGRGKLPWYSCTCSFAQSCPTVCDPMDCSLPGSSVSGFIQARILEWGYCFLLQRIFLTQGSNSHLWHSSIGRQIFTTESPKKPCYDTHWLPSQHIVGCRGPAPVDPGWFEGGDGVGVFGKIHI